MTEPLDDIDDADLTGKKLAARWKREIELYEQQTRTWYDRGDKIVRRYKDERGDNASSTSARGATKYNILWSCVQTLSPALYGRDPKPEVSRRYRDADIVGRYVSEVLERCISYSISSQNFHHTMQQAVQDRLLPGRGVLWARYVPHFRDMDMLGNSTDERDHEDDGDDDKPAQEVFYEETAVDYVYWKDFGHTVARTWDEVDAVWRITYQTRVQLRERFGDKIGDDLPLDYEPLDINDEVIKDADSKAKIYEIWDKVNKKAIWISKSYEDVLDEKDDPLELDQFFPCARPLFATLTNDSLVPVPDYVEYQDQADELDDLTNRIAQMEKSLKVAGVYDASAEGIQRLMQSGVDNQLIPIKDWSKFGQEGKLADAVAWMPIDMFINALKALYEIRDKVKQDYYEITGMSDIMRGATDPDETATAQQIKSNYGMLRLTASQNQVRIFARDIVRILGQIVAKHFSLETIKEISGVQLFTQAEKTTLQNAIALKKQLLNQAAAQAPQGQAPTKPPTDEEVAQLLGVPASDMDLLLEPTWEEVDQELRDTQHLCYHIDIETNSTIMHDDQAEKAERMEFLKSVSQFMESTGPMVAQQPLLVPLTGKLLEFGVRAFKVGRELETEFETTIAKLSKLAANPPPQPPDPAMAKVQADAQLGQQTMQGQMQLQQAKDQGSMQLEQAKLAADERRAQLQAQTDQAAQAAQQQQNTQQQQLEFEREQRQMDHEAALKKADAMMQHQFKQMDIQANFDLEMAKARLASDTQIMVAQISAQQATQQAAIEAETKADEGVAEQ